MTHSVGTWSAQQLAEFVTAISGVEDEQVAARVAVEQAAEALDADVAAIVRRDAPPTALGWPADEVPAERLLALATDGRGVLDVPGFGAVPAMVVALDDESDAHLVLARCCEPEFNAVEVGLLRAMARTLGMLARTLRTIETERERHQLLTGLARIQRAIAQRVPLVKVLDEIVALTGELLGNELPCLFLRDHDDPEMLVIAASQGIDETELPRIRRRRVGDGVAGRAVAEERLIVVDEYQHEAHTIPTFVDDGLQTAMAAPVHENGEVVGSLLVASWTPGWRYDTGRQEVLESLAQHVSLALTDAKTVSAMVHQAMHDGLTGLPNRALFLDRLEHGLARARRTGTDIAVLFLDLDRFKTVNDSLGHVAGDELLCEVAKRIDGAMRAADTAARLGGDEFGILLEDLESTHEAVRIADRILEALASPVQVAGREVLTAVSIGIATGAYNAEDLLRHADVAMYRAKAARKGGYALFESGMQAEATERIQLEADLAHAVAGNEFEVFYQPIVTLSGGGLAGHEALLRWRHPTRGLLGPYSFIPVAEETGQIAPIGRFVLREACRQAAAWDQDTPGAGLTMNVNLSSHQLEDPEFVSTVTEVLRETGLPPQRLVLEITETVLMQDTEATIERLRALRDLGVRLAVDDFGTGYSSLRYLNRFPIDVLKMAKPFVDELGIDDEDAALARAIVDLGANLGLQIVAEGVERDVQLAHLRQLGCPLAQGFLFARPMPAAEAGQRLQAPPAVV